MTQEHGKERTVLVLHGESPACVAQRQPVLVDEDEAWRSFLENPLTAASKAMMSINGDEDSAAALSLLYDYYKVPKDKISKAVKIEADGASNLIDLVSFQKPTQSMATLRTVALGGLPHLSPLSWEKGSAFHPFDSPHGIPSTYLLSQEGASQSLPVGDPAAQGSQSEAVAFSPSYSPLGLRAQAQTPDSTYTEGLAGESQAAYHSEDLHPHISSVSPGGYSHVSMLDSHQFEYTLEAPRSTSQKTSSGVMSYINKGHFYPISLRCQSKGKSGPQPNTIVRSVVMVVFHDKCVEDQLRSWKFWHSRQPSAKQHCIDIADYKESVSTVANIEEISFNAISFTWNTKDEPRIYVSVNCLSTDFSPQKGVKGLPLNLQIDTYSCSNHGDQLPLHRAYCQIKVFCDKGAERKIRDEERKVLRRKGRGQDSASTKTGGKGTLQLNPLDITVFKPMSDMVTMPVLFIPEAHFAAHQQHGTPVEEGDESVAATRSPYSAEEFGFTPSKRARRDEPERVLLYVRQETDEVFDAVLLQTPTLFGLLQAISDKFDLPVEKVSKVYKKCKKGIVVNMDDNIVQQYSNEDTFQMDLKEDRGAFSLMLTEI
ncbi:grainyhead-like protein 1 homolog isoform X1 [Alosa sapidissima]|uniref:grainyhead-like protein 1 homolog isoform X1 n=2 Tax=Alosa sapidissima TaxID=34773 RepID=UPI001C08759A|nr:grainyhead-like protein 1 homolog isoform X1 [Alosa sapidissima]